MRKQYHFRSSAKGLRAWDVHSLIRQSEHLPRIKVAMSDIAEVNETYWSHNNKPLTCNEIIEHVR